MTAMRNAAVNGESLRAAAHRRYVAIAAALLGGVVALGQFGSADRTRGVERWFIPGPWGHEAGGAPAQRSAAAYETRFIGLTDRGWARGNDLTATLPFSHNLSNIIPQELYGERPQYFPLVNGARWRPPPGPVAWNPDLGREDVAAFVAEAARWQFTVGPDVESFSVGVNDGVLFGESAETMAALGPARWFRGRPDYSPLIFTFANRVAERLAATYPNKYIGALAYYWGENVPPFQVHPQVLPFLTADRAQGYDEAFRRGELELQNRWGRAGPRRLGLYDYLYGSGFVVPRVTPRLLAENLRHARRAGFTDYYAEMSPNWGLDGPMPWLTAQLLANPEASPEALLDEYYTRYFREAAGPMRQFFRLCERQWMTQAGSAYWLKHYRNESQTVLFPAEVGRELRGWLDEAAGRARSERVRARVRLTSDAFGVTERFVALQTARVALGRAALERADWREVVAAIRRFIDARTDFLAEVAWVRREQPLALAPFVVEDYLVDDPVSGAMRVVLAGARSRGEFEAAKGACAAIDPALAEAVRASCKSGAGEDRHAVWRDGAPVPERRIAGLAYGIAVPAGWASRNEPVETLQAEWRGGAERVLRLTGARYVQIYRWEPAHPGESIWARVRVRGYVNPSAVVSLRIGFVGADGADLPGKTDFRLPEGTWSDWREMSVVASVPRAAVEATVELRVRHQSDGGWIEVEGLEFHRAALEDGEQTP